MKKREIKEAIREIHSREKDIDFPQVDEFTAFMISDGFYKRKEFDKAAKALIDYFQKNPAPVNIKKFERRISRSIAGDVRALLQKGDMVNAIQLIENHQKSWLSKSRRVDVQFFRVLAYEKLGLYDDALKGYDRLYKRMDLLRGSREERERKVFEYYPTFDQIRLREAVSAYGLGKNSRAVSYLGDIKNAKDFRKESKVDYYLTLSKLAYDSKKYERALKLVKLISDKEIKDPVKKQKFNVYLSQVFERNEKWDKAIDILEGYYKKNKGEQDQVYILSRLFNLYRDKGLKKKAIESGEKLLAEYSSKYDLDKERYYVGELHYESNNRNRAQKVWKDLTKKSMWVELAKNKMESDDWKKKTNDSMKRIPAMAK